MRRQRWMHHSYVCYVTWLVVICMVALSHAQVDEEAEQVVKVPHIDDCSLCKRCSVTQPPQPPLTPAQAAALTAEDFRPTHGPEKQTKPQCEECEGCTHTVQPLAAHGVKYLFNRTFMDEAGASPNWLFKVNSTSASHGRAVVKVACVPVPKKQGGPVPQCHPEHTARHAKLYLALDKLAQDCGFTEIVPKVWVQPLSTVLPNDIGYHIKWHAVWMEQAPGISLENLVRLGSPAMHPNQLLDFMHNVVKKDQVILAAIFDLMTSQCDRHAQNIFLNEDGQVTLIDNERALYESNHCGVDSILLPTTKKYAINVFENAWVNKFRNWGSKIPSSWANVPLLLDYRCYVPDGRIGKNWPGKVGQCLQKLHGMTVQQVMEDYGLPDLTTAAALKNRTQTMYEQGFEEALTHGQPLNPSPWRYKFTEPCCKIVHTDMYRCGVPWKPDTALPYGDPVGGGTWTKDWRDVGSYEGGTVF